MAVVNQDVDLKPYNTFGIAAKARFFCEVNSEDEFLDLISLPVYKSNKRLVLGGGSNVLFMKDFDGLVIKNNLKGIQVTPVGDEQVLVKAAAGEVWHVLVKFCIDKGYAGIENLSLIPGCVGASPMQNIGAYGVEIKDVFHSLDALDMETGSKRTFSREQCNFGYRESYFKREGKDRYFISSVTFRLSRKARLNTSYGAINTELQLAGISEPTIRDVSDAVIRIRQSKLPDPAVAGNAGSFFKNPEVSAEKFGELKSKFPSLVAYPTEGGKQKLAAGWLIESCGLKGHRHGEAMVHQKQALVLVNLGKARGEDVYQLSCEVLEAVKQKFGVVLEREVNVIS